MVMANIYMNVGCKFTKCLASSTNAKRNNFSKNLQKGSCNDIFEMSSKQAKRT